MTANCQKLRRSCRISQKDLVQNKSTRNSQEQMVSPVCMNKPLFSKSSHKYKVLSKNKSKSIFREINKKYSELENPNCNTFVEVGPFDISGNNSNNIVPSSCDFSERLSQQIYLSYLQKNITDSKKRATKQLQEIEDLLYNKKKTTNKNEEHIFVKNNSEEAQEDISYNYAVPSEWVYTTPPKQKVAAPKLEKCPIQPAVMYTNKKTKIIYELNSCESKAFKKYIKDKNIQPDNKFKRYINSIKPDECEHSKIEPYDPNNSDFFTQFRLNQWQQAKENNPHQNVFDLGRYFLECKRMD